MIGHANFLHLWFLCISNLHFWLIRKNKKLTDKNDFRVSKNDVIFHIYDKIKVSNPSLPSWDRGPLKMSLTVPLLGKFFCTGCHENTGAIIPARVVQVGIYLYLFQVFLFYGIPLNV